MDFSVYLGIGAIALGLAMSAREVARHQHHGALMSLLISLQGAQILTLAVMEPGWASRAVLAGTVVVSLLIALAASRLRRQRA